MFNAISHVVHSNYCRNSKVGTFVQKVTPITPNTLFKEVEDFTSNVSRH